MRIRSILPVCALVAALLGAPAAAASAATNPFERGPAPTAAALNAAAGPFATTTVAAQNVSGFGAAQISYPTNGAQTYGAVALAPGFLSPGSSVLWLGQRLASHGFVVVTIDTIGFLDQPTARRDQLLAALKNVQADPRVKGRIDSSRLAVAGWSMGGGGALEAGLSTPSLKAVAAITPWDLFQKNFSKLTVPALVLTADNDFIAPTADHGKPFFDSLSPTLPKAYSQFNNADHFFTNTPNNTEGTLVISWFKRFVDDDTRYDQFLCPGPAVPSTVLDSYTASCPLR